ncbi:MAG: glycosyltransferase [Actinophytocola sp.]|uniref:glycosyltransferase n=1 Tax=Actinophytocola sp. TaxID=1872138 RepID=UPI003D6C3D58
MRVLLSTIGSRGDVQPLVALALRVREHGAEVRVCAPPDFGEWIEGHGIPFVPIGPSLRGTAKAAPPRMSSTPEQRRQTVAGTVAAQFETLPAAARDCDVIVAATALQLAARSVAEHRGIRYVYASFCPAALPSPHHAPPVLAMLGDTPADGTVDNRELWAAEARRQNEIWREPLDAHRADLGLAPVDDVSAHVFTAAPWLAADPTLAPWPRTPGLDVFQPGAWILPDHRPLPAELTNFLDAGEPPVYFGFGSSRVPEGLTETMVATARAFGRRLVASRGWAELTVVDDEPDCIAVGEVNQQALFRRVAAVVHHGGAGTTTAAARAGAPQVVVPQHYDQHFFAQRVRDLGIGAAHPPTAPTTDSMTTALDHALGCAHAAESVAGAVHTDGADVAARRLVQK